MNWKYQNRQLAMAKMLLSESRWKPTIEVKVERVPHAEGLSLYYRGRKTHLGVFAHLQALRKFWRENRIVICEGYIKTGLNTEDWELVK